MSFILHPWQLFFLILSGWVNRRKQEIIDFQNAQIQALMDKLGRKRILLTDDQRRILAGKGKAIGRKAMMELTTVVTPDTILRWHRCLTGLLAIAQVRQCPGRNPAYVPVPVILVGTGSPHELRPTFYSEHLPAIQGRQDGRLRQFHFLRHIASPY